MKRLCALVCMALLVPASYAGVRPLTLADLCKNSTLIVHGTVASRHVRWEGTTIVTDWTIRPFETLKGTAGKSVNATVPGGHIGGITMHAGEAPRFRVGEEVVLFLRFGTGACDVYGWFRGKYTVIDGRIREKAGCTVVGFLAEIRKKLGTRKSGR
jgi:hypothetical protein